MTASVGFTPAEAFFGPATMNAVRVRPATKADAAVLARLMTALNTYEGKPYIEIPPERLEAHGFGDEPAFTALLAERDGAAVGYALISETYNTDIPAPGLWLSDLFVIEGERDRGVGRALMGAVARHARQRGAASIWWPVRQSNVGARRFYARLGAHDDEVGVMELEGEALSRLADTVPE